MSSERKGGPHKTERKTLNIDAETHAALLKYAQSKGLGMGILLAEFVAAGIKHDIHDPDWAQIMLAELARVKIESDPSRCPALAGSGDETDINWRCVWYREDRPPQIRKLGSTDDMMKKACLACGKTGEIIAGFMSRDQRIAELEINLKARASEVYKIPKCNRGAILDHDKEDNMIFNGCPRHRGEPVSVDKFCRVYLNGLPCMMFAELTVGVGSKA